MEVQVNPENHQDNKENQEDNIEESADNEEEEMERNGGKSIYKAGDTQITFH